MAFCFTIIALLFDLAPQKEVIARVPWNTILMIAGAGMLIAVAVQAGTIDALSAWIGSNVPTALIPLAFSFVGAFMSFFSSTTGVVAPAVPADSGTCGSNRIKSGSTLCLHDSWCTEQCDQRSHPAQPDSWFLRKRGGPKSLIQPSSLCSSTYQRYLLCGI